MQHKEYQQVKKIFQSAVELVPEERSEFLEEECGDSGPGLRMLSYGSFWFRYNTWSKCPFFANSAHALTGILPKLWRNGSSSITRYEEFRRNGRRMA